MGADDSVETVPHDGRDGEREALMGRGPSKSPARSGRWAFAIPVLIAMFLPNGFSSNVIPELSLAEFGERAIVISTSFGCVSALVSFMTCPMVGALSDHYGRRPMLAMCLILLALPVIPLALGWSLWVNMGFNILAAPGQGLVGIAFAYGADWLPEGERTRVFGLLSAAYQMTYMCAPYLGAMIYEHAPWRPTLWVLSLSISAAGVAYIALIMPSSPSRSASGTVANGPADWKKHANPVAPMRCLAKGDVTRYLAVVFSCHSIIFLGVLGTFPTYATEYIGFDRFDRAMFQGLIGLTQTIAAVMVNRVTRPLGEKRALLMAFAGQAVILTGVGIAKGRASAFVPLTGMLLTGLITPTVCAMASEHSPPEIQGEVQGAMSGVQIVSEGTGPLVFAQLIHVFWAYLGKPGWAYCVGMVLIFIEVAAVSALPKHLRPNAHTPPLVVAE